MYEIDDKIIITKSEYEEYLKKAHVIYSQRWNTESINMRLRFPYYIPTIEDIERHRDMPIADILPYYIYLMARDQSGNYLVEPDDEILAETREYLKRIYEHRIIVVDSANAEKKLIKRIKERTS